MKRGGRSHKPYYRIVVIDSRHRDGGPEVDILGIYHPCARPEPVSEVNVHKALEWLRKGATASDTAKSVLRKLGVYKHLHEGTTPEEAVASAKQAQVEQKGYTAPQLKARKKKQAEGGETAGGDEAAE
jgi:small subunit ribosomal protein S16